MRNKIINGFVVFALIILVVAGVFLFLSNKDIVQGSDSELSEIFSSKTYPNDVSKLVFELSELPEEYKIAERTPRLDSDVSDFGKNLGWKEGYYIRYVKGNEDNIFETSTIQLSISRYPIENISQSIISPVQYEGYTDERLPNPNIGEGSVATRYTDDEFGLRSYRIEFYKKDIYMNLENNGATTDYELLKDLAEKAASKI